MKIKFLIASAFLAFSVSCAGAEPKNPYTVNVNLAPENNGEVVYLFDYDTGAKLDSTIVENGIATFSGDVEAPLMARLISDGNRLGTIFLEKATIDVWPAERRIESTGELAARNDAFETEVAQLATELQSLPDDSASRTKVDSIYNLYDLKIDRLIAENSANPLGKYMFLNIASGLDLDEFDKYLTDYPELGQWQRIANMRQVFLKRAETSVGKQYKDFAVTYEGTTKRLSDYVGPDHYTIVDFWASWCGPCIRQVKVLKELYEQYGGKGLNFLSVAVWDKPEDTIEAIKAHEIPWDQIINAQSIPTDLYGISGIPCIILIAPDGTIVSRDKQSDDLKADVNAAMQSFVMPVNEE